MTIANLRFTRAVRTCLKQPFRPWVERAFAVLLGCWILSPSVSPANGAVVVGDFITPDEAGKVKDLVSPGVYSKVLRGMTMRIVAPQRIDWPPPYLEATEKYSSQVGISADGRSLVGYVAGQPFPLLDLNDPAHATKIMWNHFFRPINTDDSDLRYFDCESVYSGLNRPFQVLEYFAFGHSYTYNLVGRTEVPPLPIDPDFKTSGRYWLFGAYPQLDPPEMHGAGFVRYRYADPNRGDDIWSFSNKTRRVRRMDDNIMSSATLSGTSAESWDPDHFHGFDAKIEEYNYRFLGEKPMLASVHAEHSPETPCPTDGGASACPEAWEMRKVYVVEATPRPDRIRPVAARTVIYLDSEMWLVPYADTYDRTGNLFETRTYWLTYRDRPVPDARIAIYPFKRSFIIGLESTDQKSGLSTMCYWPGRNTPERECWYINMGAVDKDFLTVQAMVKAGQ